MTEQIHDLTLREVQERLSRALGHLCSTDACLIAWEVNERSITHYLAVHLQKEFAQWNVDVEYNRNLGNIKLLKWRPPHATGQGTPVFPDLIVHRRGKDENLLVVEVKKASGDDPEFDYRKLEAFTKRPPAGLGYRWGVHVVLPAVATDSPSTLWFPRGHHRLQVSRRSPR